MATNATDLLAGIPPPDPVANVPAPGQPPLGNAPDLGLGLGVPYTPPAPPTPAEVADQAARALLLKGTDTDTGAPVGVRAAVGAASSDADRFATIKKYFPDAQPLPGGGDNFVYTNPATGKRQTYEPIGWRVPTWGDVASVGPQIAETAGGAAGGALAAPGVVSTPVGVGLGAAAGKTGYEGLMRFLGATTDTRTPTQIALDTATTAGTNTIAPVVGEKVLGAPLTALASLLTRAPTATQTAAQQLESSGLTPGLTRLLPVGVATESPGLQRVEQGISSVAPITGGVRPGYADTRTALETGTQQLASNVAAPSPVPDASTFANNVGTVAQRITQRFDLNRQAADAYATQLIGENTPVDLQPLRDLKNQLETQMATAPGSLAPRYQPALDQINTLLADATKTGSNTLPFSVVRNIRTDLGKQIDWTASGAGVPTGIPALKQTYGALKDSLLDTASNVGPQAYAALADHDAMVERFNNGPAQTMADLADPTRRANAIGKMMQSTAPGDAQSLGQLVMYATPAERQQLQAGVIQQLGTKPDGTFDMPTWLGNFGKTTPAARNILFGPDTTPGSLQGDLNNLATVQRTMGQSAANRNFSNTAPTLLVTGALARMGQQVLSGDIKGAVATGAGTLGAPYIAGRLLTSQPFVKWLTGTWGVNAQQGGQWAAHLARLGNVAVADPSVAGLVQQLRQQLPNQIPLDQQQGGGGGGGP